MALEALGPEWRALFAACPDASPFQSPDWLLPWRRAFLSDGLWCLAVRRGGRLAGVGAFYVCRGEGGGRQLTLLGNGHSDRLDLLIDPGAAELVRQAIFAGLRRIGVWDSCDFRDLPAGSPLLAAELPAASDELSAEPPCPLVRLPARPEQVLDLLPRRRRDDLRRCARRASETGQVAYQAADSASRGQLLAELAELHAARWRARGEPGALADPVVRRFHRDAAGGLLVQGMLRLHVLRLGGQAIAALYGFRHGARAYSYLTAFDPAFASLSPGMLLTAFVLQQAVREGAREFDFLRGGEGYKYLWGARDRPQFRRRIRR